MSENNSIIHLGDLSKPATVLIEKVSNAVGVLYEPCRIVKKAAAEIEAAKLKALAGIELSEIEQRGVERLIHQQARKQENIEQITANAATDLPPDAKTEGLEEDWIAHFFDQCENVSDKQMQSLWSSLLAGEATKPGTYSKRTVSFVASMDKKDADLFTSFCQFTWMIVSPTPLIFDPKNKVYTDQGIDFGTLMHLDAIGLISFEPITGYKKLELPKQVTILYFGLPTLIEYQKDKNNEMIIGKAIFTNVGNELVSICCAKRNQKFYEYAIEQLGRQGIKLATILPKSGRPPITEEPSQTTRPTDHVPRRFG